MDADGVALAAIQGLDRKLDAESAALASELGAKEARIAALERDVAELKALVRSLSGDGARGR